MNKVMYKTKWVVFDNKGNKIKIVTLNHEDGGLYKEIELFETELNEKGLMAVKVEYLEQEHLKGKLFKEKLKYLGYSF